MTARVDASDALMAGLVAAYDAELARIRAELAARNAEPGSVDAIRWAIAAMVELDQYTRRFYTMDRGFDEQERKRFSLAMGLRGLEVDRENSAALKALVFKRGWPVISRYGREAADGAWLLAQHSDHDVEFQKTALAVLEGLMTLGEVEPAHYAYLYDRVAVNEKRPQRYGTQGACVGPGRWEPLELGDPQRVDERRAEVGLGPLAEYKASFRDVCRGADPVRS